MTILVLRNIIACNADEDSKAELIAIVDAAEKTRESCSC